MLKTLFSIRGVTSLKGIKQLGIILTILWIGQLISKYFNLPIPGAVLGMIILFVLLMFKVIKINQIQYITDILLENLPLLFIPAGVGIINEFSSLKGNLIKLSIVLIITTVIIMVVTGTVVQFLVNKKKGRTI